MFMDDYKNPQVCSTMQINYCETNEIYKKKEDLGVSDSPPNRYVLYSTNQININ